MASKRCRKFQPAEYGARVQLQTDDRQTDEGWATAYSERERGFTFAKNRANVNFSESCIPELTTSTSPFSSESRSFELSVRQRVCPANSTHHRQSSSSNMNTRIPGMFIYRKGSSDAESTEGQIEYFSCTYVHTTTAAATTTTTERKTVYEYAHHQTNTEVFSIA